MFKAVQEGKEIWLWQPVIVAQHTVVKGNLSTRQGKFAVMFQEVLAVVSVLFKNFKIVVLLKYSASHIP